VTSPGFGLYVDKASYHLPSVVSNLSVGGGLSRAAQQRATLLSSPNHGQNSLPEAGIQRLWASQELHGVVSMNGGRSG
jgi:hypothetical protein